MLTIHDSRIHRGFIWLATSGSCSKQLRRLKLCTTSGSGVQWGALYGARKAPQQIFHGTFAQGEAKLASLIAALGLQYTKRPQKGVQPHNLCEVVRDFKVKKWGDYLWPSPHSNMV